MRNHWLITCAWLRQALRRLREDQRGSAAVEYGLILALVLLVALAGIQALGGSISSAMTTIAGALTP